MPPHGRCLLNWTPTANEEGVSLCETPSWIVEGGPEPSEPRKLGSTTTFGRRGVPRLGAFEARVPLRGRALLREREGDLGTVGKLCTEAPRGRGEIRSVAAAATGVCGVPQNFQSATLTDLPSGPTRLIGAEPIPP